MCLPISAVSWLSRLSWASISSASPQTDVQIWNSEKLKMSSTTLGGTPLARARTKRYAEFRSVFSHKLIFDRTTIAISRSCFCKRKTMRPEPQIWENAQTMERESDLALTNSQDSRWSNRFGSNGCDCQDLLIYTVVTYHSAKKAAAYREMVRKVKVLCMRDPGLSISCVGSHPEWKVLLSLRVPLAGNRKGKDS